MLLLQRVSNIKQFGVNIFIIATENYLLCVESVYKFLRRTRLLWSRRQHGVHIKFFPENWLVLHVLSHILEVVYTASLLHLGTLSSCSSTSKLLFGEIRLVSKLQQSLNNFFFCFIISILKASFLSPAN